MSDIAIKFVHEGGASSPFGNPLDVKEEDLKDFKTFVSPGQLDNPKEDLPAIKEPEPAPVIAEAEITATKSNPTPIIIVVVVILILLGMGILYFQKKKKG